MLRFVLMRLSQMLVSLLVITFIVFSLSHLTGSPIDALVFRNDSCHQSGK